MNFAVQMLLVMLQRPGRKALVRTAQVAVQLQGTSVRAGSPCRLCAVVRCCQYCHGMQQAQAPPAHAAPQVGNHPGAWWAQNPWYDVIDIEQIIRPVYLQPDPAEENHVCYNHFVK